MNAVFHTDAENKPAGGRGRGMEVAKSYKLPGVKYTPGV